MDGTGLGPLLVIAFVAALIAGSIAQNKGQSFATYFVIGLLLPVIGIILAAIAPPAVSRRLGELTPAASEGWHQDPTGRFDRRYFDGRHWTRFVTRDAERRQIEDPL